MSADNFDAAIIQFFQKKKKLENDIVLQDVSWWLQHVCEWW